MPISIAKLISCIDLTRLNDDDTKANIIALCQSATTPFGPVAAVCVHMPFVHLAKQHLPKSIHVATVINFPHGTTPIKQCIADIQQAIDDGADELDVVMPYSAFMMGKNKMVRAFLSRCRQLTKKHILKIIIESGALVTTSLIHQAASLVVESGADFVKTSTGKIKMGATLAASAEILRVIKEKNANTGIKISGSIRTHEQTMTYVEQAIAIMGKNWISPTHFRVGASSLLNDLLTL